jgi:hypothetical protein
MTQVMNVKLSLLLAVSFGIAGAVFAGDESSLFDTTSPAQARTERNTDQLYWERALRESKELPDVKLGKSDYVINGALVNGLRRGRSSPDLSLGKRILRLPIIRLFVPDPMPSSPDGGRYWLWGESSRPWTALAEREAAGDLSNPVTHEAHTLIFISR